MNKTSSNARLKASLEELAQFGSPVDLSVAVIEVEDEKVEIDQVGGVYESHIFDLEDGHVACIADIAVTNQTGRTIDVVDFELRATWDNNLFELLTPHQVKLQGRAKRGSSCSVYKFPGKHGLELEYGEVINHHFLERKRLPAKRRLAGWLLGIGRRMPAGLRHGEMQDVHLKIIGADHTEYARTIHLWTDRSQVPTKIVTTRESIFERPVVERASHARGVSRIAPIPASQSTASNRSKRELLELAQEWIRSGGRIDLSNGGRID
jgi:hypothetical protein